MKQNFQYAHPLASFTSHHSLSPPLCFLSLLSLPELCPLYYVRSEEEEAAQGVV